MAERRTSQSICSPPVPSAWSDGLRRYGQKRNGHRSGYLRAASGRNMHECAFHQDLDLPSTIGSNNTGSHCAPPERGHFFSAEWRCDTSCSPLPVLQRCCLNQAGAVVSCHTETHGRDPKVNARSPIIHKSQTLKSPSRRTLPWRPVCLTLGPA